MKENLFSKYAPVIIPTVNRYLHLKECLESLSNCTGADKTDVFIAVDYPGKNEHWEGYRKIKDYLGHCGDMGFKSLNVIYREENYYYSGKGNVSSLIRDISKIYDRYILSEDDNVFSPNFLEYINKGLELYQHDDSVMAVCGYSHPINFIHADNNTFRQQINYSAWGVGVWKSKNEKYRQYFVSDFFRGILKSPRKLYCVWKTGYGRVMATIIAANKERVPWTDYNCSIIMRITDRCVVMPIKSKVRNMGWDETAAHTRTNSSQNVKRSGVENSAVIDTDTYFEYIGDNHYGIKENNDKMIEFGKMFFKPSLRFKCVVLFKYLWTLFRC